MSSSTRQTLWSRLLLFACSPNHPPIGQVPANPAQPTAPDAFAQVKKGLRGLFGRKKKHQDQPTPTTGAPSGSNSTAAPGAASSVPEPTKTGIYSITSYSASNSQSSKTCFYRGSSARSSPTLQHRFPASYRRQDLRIHSRGSKAFRARDPSPPTKGSPGRERKTRGPSLKCQDPHSRCPASSGSDGGARYERYIRPA